MAFIHSIWQRFIVTQSFSAGPDPQKKMELNWFMKFNLFESSDFVVSLATPSSIFHLHSLYLPRDTSSSHRLYERWLWNMSVSAAIQYTCHIVLSLRRCRRRRRRQRCHEKDKTIENMQNAVSKWKSSLFSFLFFPSLFLYIYITSHYYRMAWLSVCLYANTNHRNNGLKYILDS